jgi:ApaG protein
MSVSTAVTRGIRVDVNCRYAPNHSDPRKRKWFFLYTITIVNEGTDTVQLLNRHWIIMDATGKIDEVHGPGVVGEQPVLEPGERFEYTSGCPLETSFGSMRGTYEMATEPGSRFLVEIAPFSLRVSDAAN